jgi:hypothetical protein
MKWKGKELKSKGDYVDALQTIVNQALADEFMELARDEDEDHADENIGYMIGYLGAQDQERLYLLCEVEHPIFGRRVDISAEEAFAMGMAMVRGSKGTAVDLLDINNAMAALHDSQEAMDDAQRKNRDARQALKEAMASYSGIPASSLQLGSWNCPGSPSGLCYYDLRGHMGDDECAVCGGPDERK